MAKSISSFSELQVGDFVYVAWEYKLFKGNTDDLKRIRSWSLAKVTRVMTDEKYPVEVVMLCSSENSTIDNGKKVYLTHKMLSDTNKKTKLDKNLPMPFIYREVKKLNDKEAAAYMI